MTSILLRLAALASCLAMASSSRAHHKAATVSSAKTFHLVLNVTIAGTDFAGNASLNKVFLGTEHVGAGHTALVPSLSGAGGAVDLAYTVNSTIQDGLSPNYWESFYMGSSPDQGSEDLYAVELIIGSEAEFGVSIIDDEVGDTDCLAVSSSVKNGTFAICNQGFDAPEAPQYSLYFVQGESADWYAVDNVPDNCVAVKLLPQCSSSDEFDDSEEVQEVLCYEDVASIDWSRQAVCS